MSDDLDARLRQLTQEMTDAAPPAHAWSTVKARAERDVIPSMLGRRWMAAVAAVAIVLVGIVALVAVNSSGDEQPIADEPVTSGPPPIGTTIPSTTSSSPATTIVPTMVSIERRVLVDGADVGDPYVTALATTAEEMDALWTELGIGGPVPAVDFANEVVVYFGAGESCELDPLGMVWFDMASRRLYPELSPPPDEVCPDILQSHAVIIAIDREDLPEPPFEIWVDADGPQGDEAAGVTVVTADRLGMESSGTTLPPDTTTSTTVPAAGDDTTWKMTFPSGSFTVGPDDLFATHVDGDLWLHPGILGDSPGEPVRVADFGDPREPVTEGPGPNVVDEVAGVVDGAVLYGDCCEPVVGNLYAATTPDAERAPLGYGAQPALSPDGRQLAITQLDGFAVGDLETGVARGRTLTADGGEYVQAMDIVWTSDDEIAVHVLVGDRSELRYFTADETLSPVGTATRMDFDPSGGSWLSIAGVVDGSVYVSSTGSDGTFLHVIAPASRPESTTPPEQLPGGAREPRVRGDGAVLWVDDSTLWFRPAGGEPRSLGTGFSAAWFATAG